MQSNEFSFLGPLKLFELTCVISFLSPADKLLSLAPLSSDWHKIIYKPYFWKRLPSSLMMASFATLRSDPLRRSHWGECSFSLSQTPLKLSCLLSRDGRLSWVPHPQWIQFHFSSPAAEHSFPLKNNQTCYYRLNSRTQVHQLSSKFKTASSTPALISSWELPSPSSALITRTSYSDPWFLGWATLQTQLEWVSAFEAFQDRENKQLKRWNETRSDWSFDWPRGSQSDRNQSDGAGRHSQKLTSTQGNQTRPPALFSLSLRLT